MISPGNNIKTMEVSTAPEKFPELFIREARMVL